MNLLRGTDATGVPGPEQLHLQFGPDAATQMVASWATPVPVAQTRLRLGTLDGGFGTTIDAVMRTYTEAITGQPVGPTTPCWTISSPPRTTSTRCCTTERLRSVAGSEPGLWGERPFASRASATYPSLPGGCAGLGPASANAAYTVDAVEATDPLFHLINGDLSYANCSDAPVETWRASEAILSPPAPENPAPTEGW